MQIQKKTCKNGASQQKIGPSCFDRAFVPNDTNTFLSQKNIMAKCFNEDINAEGGQSVKSKILGLKEKFYFFTF